MHGFLGVRCAPLASHLVCIARVSEADESIQTKLVAVELHGFDGAKYLESLPKYGFGPIQRYEFNVQIIPILHQFRIFWTQLRQALMVFGLICSGNISLVRGSHDLV